MEKTILTVKEFRRILLDEPYFSAETESLSTMSDVVLLNQRLVEDFNMDSLDIVELVMTIERNNHIAIPDDAIDVWAKSDGTVKDLLDMINTCSV